VPPIVVLAEEIPPVVLDPPRPTLLPVVETPPVALVPPVSAFDEPPVVGEVVPAVELSLPPVLPGVVSVVVVEEHAAMRFKHTSTPDRSREHRILQRQ
jgi:hypothetical protein